MSHEKFFRIDNEARHLVLRAGKRFRFSINKRFLPLRRDYINRFFEHYTTDCTVLLVEANIYHYETLPGYYYYLKKLGYDVEIAIVSTNIECFSRCSPKPIVWKFTEKEVFDILTDSRLKKFSRIIINSKIIYPTTNVEVDINKYLPNLQSGKSKNLYVQHHIDKLSEKENEIILANPSANPNLEKYVVNPHYFGEIKITPKNSNITNFIIVGDFNIKRRNVDLLIESIKELSKIVRNFKITVVGYKNNKNIPGIISDYFDIVGRLDYSAMYEEVEKADFFLSLLDPNVVQHERYMKYGTSGTFQLVYGFVKPCVIHKTFADIYGFSEKNSVIYNKNEKFIECMLQAIQMNNKKYSDMQRNLKILAKKIEKRSLENLACIMGQ